MRGTLSDAGTKWVQGCWKVKAHSLGKPQGSEAERHKAQANDWADIFAKLGAKQHPAASREEETRLLKDFADVEKVGRLVEALWGLWPPLPRGLVKGPKKKTLKRQENKRQAPHCWKFGLGRWQCSNCLAVAATTKSTQARAKERCKGRNPRQASCPDRGHKMQKSSCDGVDIHYCTSCGAWSTKKLRHLAKVCSQLAVGAGKVALAKLSRGFHPGRKGQANDHPGGLEGPKGAFKKEQGCKGQDQLQRSGAQERLAGVLERVKAKQARRQAEGGPQEELGLLMS